MTPYEFSKFLKMKLLLILIKKLAGFVCISIDRLRTDGWTNNTDIQKLTQ